MQWQPNRVLIPAAIALMFAGGSALAQGTEPAPQQQQPPPQQQSPAAQTPSPEQLSTAPVSDAEIEQFAAAAVEVQTLHNQAAPKLEQADDAEELARLREETEREMLWAIEETGLTVQRYQEIFVAFQSDPEINAKVREKLPE
jgi:hypothetical protein